MSAEVNCPRKPHQCENCSKSFASSHQLAQHMRIHTGEKPYKCAFCDKSFKQLSHLQQHTRLHTGERPYKCPMVQCGRAFIQLSNLQQHMRSHMSTQEKLEKDRDKCHYCLVCRKGFKAQANLLTHKCKKNLATEKRTINHVCPVCQAEYQNREVLIDHLREEHEFSYENSSKRNQASSTFCPICGRSYTNEGSLRKHISTVHPDALNITQHNSSSSLLDGILACNVCRMTFSSQADFLRHMEQMRTNPRHQFEAQIVLSCAAAESRAREASINRIQINQPLMISQLGQGKCQDRNIPGQSNTTLITIRAKDAAQLICRPSNIQNNQQHNNME